MRPFFWFALAAGIVSGEGARADSPQPPSEDSVTAHVAAATIAAGTDLKKLLPLCRSWPDKRPPREQADKFMAEQMARPAPPPGRAFDNLYYVGAAWVSAWALKTSDGIILFDALNNQTEVPLIEEGLRKVGLDPAQLKYLVITHAHGDHYGGATYLVERYKPRVVMTARDWRETEGPLEADSKLWGPVPKRDIAVNDGEQIKFGDTTVTIRVTAGHTPGTLSPTFDVTSGGQRHRVLLWGGTAFNFGRNMERLDSYIASTQRMAKVSEEEGIDVLLSNHSSYDGSLEKLEAARQHPAENPFVMGTPAVKRALTIMGECALAQRDRFLMRPASGPSAEDEAQTRFAEADPEVVELMLFAGQRW